MKRFHRTLLGIALFIAISSATICGVYHYALDRYADQLDDALGAITHDPPTATTEGTGPKPDVQPVPQPPAAGPATSPTQPRPAVTPPTNSSEPQPPQGTSTASNPEQALANAATADLNLSSTEKADVSLALDILGKMTMQEKLFFFQTVARFTPSELLELYRLFREGDSGSMDELKQKLVSRFTADDIERIKEIAEKYRPETETAPPHNP